MSKSKQTSDTGTGVTSLSSQPRPTKAARLKTLLRRPKGATQKQLEKSLGWQPHTVRAAISRLRKGGTEVLLDRSANRPVYRIDAQA
ncbi:MAG: DUF3489 domain-containing protein [Silicimonas sp.]|nr:DUF3489 domain-containing protein [Silicimonas sp.]